MNIIIKDGNTTIQIVHIPFQQALNCFHGDYAVDMYYFKHKVNWF